MYSEGSYTGVCRAGGAETTGLNKQARQPGEFKEGYDRLCRKRKKWCSLNKNDDTHGNKRVQAITIRS